MRLIDADKLKRKCQKTATEAWKMKIKASIETTLNQFIDWIDQAEPVDAVPVVRCKDCKHWRDSDGVYRRGVGVESKCPINLAAVYKGTFYCGFGERKDGDHHD